MTRGWGGPQRVWGGRASKPGHFCQMAAAAQKKSFAAGKGTTSAPRCSSQRPPLTSCSVRCTQLPPSSHKQPSNRDQVLSGTAVSVYQCSLGWPGPLTSLSQSPGCLLPHTADWLPLGLPISHPNTCATERRHLHRTNQAELCSVLTPTGACCSPYSPQVNSLGTS
jgi:hypothetical protein